jgi:hypothetical protein
MRHNGACGRRVLLVEARNLATQGAARGGEHTAAIHRAARPRKHKDAERCGHGRPNVYRMSCGEAPRASGTSGAPRAATNEKLGGSELRAA